MTGTDAPQERPRKGFPEKREAILRAARKVFGQVGYVGASIGLIAAEAAVSTRTIYNHFAHKEELFATVLIDSSQEVAAAHEAMIDRHLGATGSTGDLEADLVALAEEWARPRPEFTDHFAIVGRIHAEGESFPADLRESWQQAGPLRVQAALAAALTALAERGALRVADPAFMAEHFVSLISPAARPRTSPLSAPELARRARAGVRTFLYGYAPGADRD
ncbi:TetR/AcrR family transcriptional regulator [Streptomyces albidoflavus]|uniref:TetR/AcrR family transcriptional regulator n=1 Tax=Streptomyces albidoflavus TaxID=1886 RepID=UPI0033B50303